MALHHDQARPRLMIRQMVLENFKSYAGTQYVGPFHKVRSARGNIAALGAQQQQRPHAHNTKPTLHAHRTSPQLWDQTAAASPTSSMPCCSCLAGAPSRCAHQYHVMRLPSCSLREQSVWAVCT